MMMKKKMMMITMNLMEVATNLLKRKLHRATALALVFLTVVMVMKLMMVMCKSESERILPCRFELYMVIRAASCDVFYMI